MYQISEDKFLQRMERTWKQEFKNTITHPLRDAWKTILSAFNDQLAGKKGLLTCDAVCGTGKTLSLTEALTVMAQESPHTGAIVVVRQTCQCDEIAERINKSVGKQVAIPVHSKSGGRHKQELIDDSQIVIITHSRYLASVSPASGSVTFKHWKHGERLFRVCDESLDLVERHSLTLNELFEIRNAIESLPDFYLDIEPLFQSEFQLLSRVIRAVGTTTQKYLGYDSNLLNQILTEDDINTNLSAFEEVIKEQDGKRWCSFKPPTKCDKQFELECFKEDIISKIATFDRILRYRIFVDKEYGLNNRVSTGTFVLPESFDSLVVLDATSNVEVMYKYLGEKCTKYPVSRDVRLFKNARLHFRPDNSGLGKSSSKKSKDKRIPQIVDWANQRFTKDDRVLFVGAKVLMAPLTEVAQTGAFDFTSKFTDCDGNQRDNIAFAHYGMIDGKNTWKDFTSIVILSLPFMPNYFSPTGQLAVQQVNPSHVFEDNDNLATSSIAVQLIQAICRICVRRVTDSKGNCPESDIYLLLPMMRSHSIIATEDQDYVPLLRSDGKFFLDEIKSSLNGVSVDQWEDFGGYSEQQKSTASNSYLFNAFVSWISGMKPGEVKRKKDFEDLLKLDQKQKSSLAVMLSNRNNKRLSPISAHLKSINVEIVSKPRVGTTFIKMEK